MVPELSYSHGLTNNSELVSEKEFLVYFIVKEACRGTPLAPPTHRGLCPHASGPDQSKIASAASIEEMLGNHSLLLH